jgi:hypothetical protein
MEKLAVVTGADLVDGRWIKINEDGPRYVFPIARLSEEGFK